MSKVHIAYQIVQIKPNLTVAKLFRPHDVIMLEFLMSLQELDAASGETHEFIIYTMRQQAITDNLTICYRNKQIQFFLLLSCY